MRPKIFVLKWCIARLPRMIIPSSMIGDIDAFLQ
jgi:hypothetical protein